MKVYCPYCRKDVEYKIEKRDVKEFRNVAINTYENVAICKKCNQDLYINEIENENNERIYEIYREKTNIIKPQDIIDLREKYNISQRELTSILGFGKMTINRYENGGVPTKSQSDYLKLLIDNENQFIKRVKEAYNNEKITKKTYEKIIEKVSFNEITNDDIQQMYRKYINSKLKRSPDIYNGYKLFDLELVENIISYIASKVKNLTITSLNKYLWFIDIISYNKRAKSITGLTYVHEQYGPVIYNRKYEEISKLEEKYKREDVENKDGSIQSKIVSNENYDMSIFSDKEMQIIDYVINLLKDKSVKEISNLSHKEFGWKNTERFEKIPFEYADDILILN